MVKCFKKTCHHLKYLIELQRKINALDQVGVITWPRLLERVHIQLCPHLPIIDLNRVKFTRSTVCYGISDWLA